MSAADAMVFVIDDDPSFRDSVELLIRSPPRFLSLLNVNTPPLP